MDDYQTTSDLIIRQVLEQNQYLKHKRPNTNSAFLTQYDKIQSMGGITFATLYTGGVLQTTHQQYKELYSTYYTIDIIKKQAILALTEICPNSIGVRCYFEFDYRSWIRLPTEFEMIEHVKMAQLLIKESFPIEEGNDITCHVAKCTPKIKFAAESKNEKGKLAIGTHLVFAQIIVNTQQLRQLALTLDARITSKYPFFNGIVDAASVHKDNASLRPLYAYKLDECKGCYPIRKPKPIKATTKKPNKPLETKALTNEKSWCGENLVLLESADNYESDSEPEAPLLQNGLECNSEGCIRGKKFASPSVYKPWFILFDNEPDMFDEDLADNLQIKNWIEDMSIVPPFGLRPNIYHKVPDAIEVDNLNVKDGRSIIYKIEKSLFVSKSSETRFSSQSHTDLYSVVSEIIHDFDSEHYSSVTISSISYTAKSCSMLVSLKGSKEQKFCLLKNDYHSSNRVFFFLKLKSKKQNKSEIRLCCHNEECKKLLNYFHKNQKSNNLSKHEKKLKKLKNEEIQITAVQKLLLFKTTKEIPYQLRNKVKVLLHLHDPSSDIPDIKEIKPNETSLDGLRMNLPNGDSLPVPLLLDERIGMMVTKEEYSLPVPTKKRNLIELNPSYGFVGDVILPKEEVQIKKQASQEEKYATAFCLLDELLKD